jgi:transposase
MRYELSNNEWSIIRVMLPTKPRDVPRVDDRCVLNGIFLGLAVWCPPGVTLQPSTAPRTTSYNPSFAGEGPASGTTSCKR